MKIIKGVKGNYNLKISKQGTDGILLEVGDDIYGRMGVVVDKYELIAVLTENIPGEKHE